ncbi:MAG: heme exporter protein CcmB [Gammaproteobacteria bacterium]|nr:heme exporter protein CcmB [Gammaproteobacteria bacterium]MDE0444831.1 heme exporter protein CcmB [Gammaproteobacteria bacterium]
MRLFVTQFRRDLLVAVRSRSDAANPLAFFVLATVLLGLGAGAQLAPGVIWVLALFANVLAVEGVFRRDHDDGTLEQLLIHAQPLFPAVMGKLAAHWALSGLPVAVLSPVAAIMLTGTANGVGVLVLSLCIGTPALTLLGAIGSALIVATGRGGLLVAILVLPFYVPVLIFGASASTAAMLGEPVAFQLLALAALLAASLTAAPFAVGKALAISQEY